MTGQAGWSADLKVAVDVSGGRMVVRVGGEIDLATVPALRDALAAAQARHRAEGLNGPVAVDVSDVRFIDASGLGVLVAAARRGREGGGDLVLRDPSPRMYRLLELTGLFDALAVERVQAGDAIGLVA